MRGERYDRAVAYFLGKLEEPPPEKTTFMQLMRDLWATYRTYRRIGIPPARAIALILL